MPGFPRAAAPGFGAGVSARGSRLSRAPRHRAGDKDCASNFSRSLPPCFLSKQRSNPSRAAAMKSASPTANIGSASPIARAWRARGMSLAPCRVAKSGPGEWPGHRPLGGGPRPMSPHPIRIPSTGPSRRTLGVVAWGPGGGGGGGWGGVGGGCCAHGRAVDSGAPHTLVRVESPHSHLTKKPQPGGPRAVLGIGSRFPTPPPAAARGRTRAAGVGVAGTRDQEVQGTMRVRLQSPRNGRQARPNRVRRRDREADPRRDFGSLRSPPSARAARRSAQPPDTRVRIDRRRSGGWPC